MLTSNFEMIRTNSAHIGSSAIVSPLTGKPLEEDTSAVGKKNANGVFESYLLNAVEYVNGKQIASADNVEKLITDPDSVDIHDVTTAMAEASMSLSLAQTVIDRLVSGWNEITTTR